MVLAKVRDKKTQLDRTVTQKAYSMIPNRYILLGYQDEEGNEVSGPTAVVQGEKKREVAKAAEPAPVEDKSGLTREDLDRMNQEAMEKAKQKAEAAKPKEVVAALPKAAPVKKATTPKKK